MVVIGLEFGVAEIICKLGEIPVVVLIGLEFGVAEIICKLGERAMGLVSIDDTPTWQKLF